MRDHTLVENELFDFL